MKIRVFEFTEHGSILIYKDGSISRIENTKELDAQEWIDVKTFTPRLADQAADMMPPLIELHMDDSRTKIALFCEMYKAWFLKKNPGHDEHAARYIVRPAEKRQVEAIEVTPQLLQVYFASNQWWCKAKSLANYCHNYNLVLQEQANSGKEDNNFPNAYSEKFAKGLDGKQLTAYYKHLRDLGWTTQQVKGRGKIWIKPS